MHFNSHRVPDDYRQYTVKKKIFIGLIFSLLLMTFSASVSCGSISIPLSDIFRALFKADVSRQLELIIWNIRLPQTLTAIVAGAGLAGAGTVMQSVLKNPLASPFTLGIAHAAAFGAAVSVMFIGTGLFTVSTSPAVTLLSAFIFSMGTACVITYIAKTRQASPEVMVLTGVALGAIFTAGTMMLQFFADDVQLAAMVFWTFGDVNRTDWSDISILSVTTGSGLLYFLANAWNYNAMNMGDETAKSLGINVERIRLTGMMVASLITAIIIAFTGIIGFIGLVSPHIVRRIIGDDHRFLMPASITTGALVLLASDIIARLILLPHVLPVSIFTSFLGAPVFIYLIMKGDSK